MSKSLKLFATAAAPAAAVLVVAYNFADRNVTAMPPLPDRSEAIAAYTAPPPSPLMAAVATEGDATAKFGLGRPALPEEIAAWDVDIQPDGTGLPDGSGDVWTGEELFEDNCAICHGSFGEGVDNWPKLAGGMGTLADEDPLKTVGSYWPYLSTVWDYVNRSMPFGGAQTLTADEVYAITAYILYNNDLVDDDFTLSKENFAEVELPNAGGFIVDDRAETEYPIWTGAPCMENCKDSVEITMRARVLDVTPEEDGAEEAAETMGAESSGGAPVEVAAAETTETTAEMAETEEAVVAVAADPELIATGEKVFKKCKACHKVGDGAKHGTGPHLNGIVGAAVGAKDFKYSKALTSLADSGAVWDEAALAAFLEDPKGFAKGTRMSFRGLKKAEDVAAVTAYLATFAE
ncbi:MAG: c-type cytochrome [Rhodobacter sp.]|nr:c-type cytochrome [Rhodobacter sp.]